jgi:hypothetical protein
MKMPFSLDMARKFFQKKKWCKKQMTACLMSGNQMFLSTNIMKTHPASESMGSFIHAELGVLRHLEPGPAPKGTILAIYRERADGSVGNSKPCSSCMEMIKARGIKKIHYTVDNGFVSERIH